MPVPRSRNKLQPFLKRLNIRLAGLQTDWRTIQLARQVSRHSPLDEGKKPVIFFNASTRLNTLSQNAGFAMLAAWAVQLAGSPVIHFVCQAGMSRCVLGTDQDDFGVTPPCQACMRQSRLNTHAAQVRPFVYREDTNLQTCLVDLTLDALAGFEYPLADRSLPLGALVLPSIRWRLRRSSLPDDEDTRFLFRQYILSAWNVAREFEALLEDTQPQAVLVFNGQFFPEAVVRWLCQQRGIFSVTHEVAMQPLSGFFTPGEATAYPISMPENFALTDAQNTRLDAYLEKRLQGNFSMAGIHFWPEMKTLAPAFLEKAARFKQIVPIFTNVIFDTSQPQSNVVFEDMFAWLDLVLELVQRHPETLFVLRAHPDEKRAGKQSLQSVSAWAVEHGVNGLENVVFVDSLEYISSYELIEHSKFIMTYNSTIGLEAAILGKAVLCAGRSRFTSYPIVFFPDTPAGYRNQAEDFLAADRVQVPPKFSENARRFLYYQLYRSSLPFNEFLEPSLVPGVIQLKKSNWKAIANSPVMKTLVQGLVEQTPFLFTQD
ncbi:MAG TPA: hypothetical protein DEP80_07260 [Anaerolineae bacterium]|nr:hypothetical protein [Anaerolineae bacterium]HCM96392.1 hypothetical protein [Anaerolineae bacterium]